MSKVAVIVVYFGRFPNYFGLWLKSCEYNPSVDFWVITDQEIEHCPKNVVLHKMQMSELRKRASAALGMDVALNRPYKCCDLRPAYGVIFADLISEYDYWGHCDIDLIFGDIRQYLTDNELEKYDKFGAMGHLSLYRNCDKVNHAFEHQVAPVKPYKEIFSTEANCFFDELMGIYPMMKAQGFDIFTKRIFADIATMYDRFRVIDVYPLDSKPMNYPVQSFVWKNGKTYRVYISGGDVLWEEYCYVHFQKRPNFSIDERLLKSEAFYITKNGFVEMEDEPTEKVLKNLNPYKGDLYETLENRYKLYRRRLQNYIKRKKQK